jgi:hypothetical protein
MNARLSPSVRTAAAPLLVVAALAALLSLGLPWASAMDLKWGTPYWMPGLCHTVYDSDGWASTECDQMWIGYGYGLQKSDTFVGYQRAVRVLAPAAAVLLLIGLRTGRKSLMATGFGVAVAGLVIGGLRVYPGQVVYAVALVALAGWLYCTGRLFRRPYAAGS